MNRWNAFRSQYGGLGLSQKQLSRAYRGQTGGGDPVEEFLAAIEGPVPKLLTIYYQGGAEVHYTKMPGDNLVMVTVGVELGPAHHVGQFIEATTDSLNRSIYSNGQPTRWRLSEVTFASSGVTFRTIAEEDIIPRGSYTKSANKR
jgi:hypothetical protein